MRQKDCDASKKVLGSSATLQWIQKAQVPWGLVAASRRFGLVFFDEKIFAVHACLDIARKACCQALLK
jgi:hypothetical protein